MVYRFEMSPRKNAIPSLKTREGSSHSSVDKMAKSLSKALEGLSGVIDQ